MSAFRTVLIFALAWNVGGAQSSGPTISATKKSVDSKDSTHPSKLPVVWEYPTLHSFPQAILCDQMGREYLHVALKNGGLAILHIANPKVIPKEVAVVKCAKLGGLDVMHLTQQKDKLYLALGDFFNAKGSPAGLAIVSVARPAEPRVLSVWQSPATLQGAAAVLVQGKYAYLGAMNHGVMIFDVSDPRKPEEVASILPDVHFPRRNPNRVQHPNARGFAVKGKHLYVAFDAGGLRVLDIDNPLKPREIGRYVNAGMAKRQEAYNNLVIDGTTAYAAIDYACLEILDIRDPANIKQIAWWNPWEAGTLKNMWFNSPGHTNQIEYDAKERRVYLSAGDSDLLVVDVSDRAHPRLVARHGEPKDKQGVWGLTISKDYVYLAYITAVVPFHSTWAGIKAIKR